LFYSYATCGGTNAFDSAGDATCKCIAPPSPHPFVNASDATKVDAHTGGNDTSTPPKPIVTLYPLNYGFHNCVKQDYWLPPTCADATNKPKTDAPDWCGKKWCFVDKAACAYTGDDVPVASSYFKREGKTDVLFYSYKTCGETDTFTTGAVKLAMASTVAVAGYMML